MALGIWSTLTGVGDQYYRLTHESSLTLAVTGLSRAGKTVFLTSLLHNLLCAGRGTDGRAAALAGFEPVFHRNLRTSRLASSGHGNRPRFPFEKGRDALASETPRWPRPTGAVSEIAIQVRFGPPSAAPPHNGTRVADFTLRLLDYPGEWLLDLPLLEQSFAQWSSEAIELSRKGSRAHLSEAWRTFVTGKDTSGRNDDEFCRRAAELWQDYLNKSRRYDLTFLQPGRFLRLAEQGGEDVLPTLDRPQLWFCPLEPPPARQWRSGSIGSEMAERYDAYRSDTVARFFRDTFASCRRQLVLVDVLAALNGGEEVFEDTCQAVSRVCTLIRTTPRSVGEKLWSSLGLAGMERVAFAATKADCVPRSQRQNLSSLPRAMLDQEARDAGFAKAKVETHYLASLCATDTETVELDGVRHDAVVGIRTDTGTRSKVVPPAVPAGLPDHADWSRWHSDGVSGFTFPTFRPPRLDRNNQAGIRSVGMDRLLNFLIADRLR